MSALLLAAHHDDAELWASFQCLKHKPRIVVVTTPRLQERWGVFAAEREAESLAAAQILGCNYAQIAKHLYDDEGVDIYAPLVHWLERDVEANGEPDIVIAPAWEQGGHEQHNVVARAARQVFGSRPISYLSYTREGRSRSGIEVVPDEPEWIACKLQALACYRSQLRVPNCRPWFYDQLDVREWVAS